MSEAQIQAIKDVMKMTPKLNVECLYSIRTLMEKAIESQLLKLEPTIILEKYLTESKDTRKEEIKNAVSFEEILKREGLTLDDLQD